MANKNSQLSKAKKRKRDEFYTQLTDIEKELRHYTEFFRNKTVLCNCDDPKISNFFVYFVRNFKILGLKRLITTCYKNQQPELFSTNQCEHAVYLIYDGGDDNNPDPSKVATSAIQLQGNGDFRSKECLDLLQQADVVVTNPPFSLFREYVKQLIDNDKKFLIISNQNSITYKEIFPLFKANKIWLGYGFNRNCAHFITHDYEDIATDQDHKEGMIRVSGVTWFTNIDHQKRHEPLDLYKKYNEEDYPKYDNYDAIEVSTTSDIPIDYDGCMGVPITFIDKYCPSQFEILNCSAYADITASGCGALLVNGEKKYARLIIKRICNEKE